MKCEYNFLRYKNILILCSLFILFLGFLGDFITTIIWWNRIHPWFSHGIDEGKIVYQCLLSCWILSLIGLIFSLLYLITSLFFEPFIARITSNKFIKIILFALLGCISTGSIVSGAYGSSFALHNPSEKGNEKQKCAKYKFKGYLGASLWVSHHKEKYAEYQKFFDELFDYHRPEGFLCRDVGASTLAFVLVQIIAIAFLIVILIMFLIFVKIQKI